ncbi:MAG: sigma-54-dependent Fis family transcriptional regulator [Myxococcales bacterium]|nr:sigma-54-dependent Fis family transcriptional regulator [Myxococcales bacterium]
MTPRLAVLDDEHRVAEILALVLRREGYTVDAFHAPAACLQALADRAYDLLITDLRMPDLDGVEVLRRARALDPALPVILITAHADVPTAIAAMREGAFDYVQKPFDNEACRALVRRALEVTRLARENRVLRAELKARYALDDLVAVSAPMVDALDLARRAARSNVTVLITGESGTGKEVIARAIHVHSDRVARPFVAVNCKAFAEGVVESELFGHERGAFTGADRARPGVFEQAEGGTLFLDEIGEVGPDFQARLLRVLQEREVRRVGADRARPVDVRVLAATNRDLQAEVRAGRFREDLYFRLAVIPIQIAPLRDRRADVLPMARAFLVRMNAAQGRALSGWTEEVERWLLTHDWPGNVRELWNTLERGVVLARGDVITLADLLIGATSPAGPADELLSAHLDRRAAEHIRATLAAVGGTRVEAARRLGIDRTTLYRLMQKYGIDDA